jgi:hypothetical protein
MKHDKIFQQYIWIVNTLRQYKKLWLEQLNELWVKDEAIGGEPLNRKSFLRHKDAILNMFGIIIECDLEHGYKYFISNPEVINDDTIEGWMLSTLTVNTVLSDSVSLRNRILLENVPAGEEFLQTIIRAIKQNKKILISYRRFGADSSEKTVAPYALKLFHQRWYLLGRKEDGALLTFALDRIVMLELTKKKFKFDESLNASDYFEDCYGVMKDETKPAERIVLRAYGTEANYLRDLKLHHSQKEIATADEYSDFELFLRPSMDFRGKIMERGDRLEVMEPGHLANEIELAHLHSVKLYENRKDILKV